jgi:hypothetical protein
MRTRERRDDTPENGVFLTLLLVDVLVPVRSSRHGSTWQRVRSRLFSDEMMKYFPLLEKSKKSQTMSRAAAEIDLCPFFLASVESKP